MTQRYSWHSRLRRLRTGGLALLGLCMSVVSALAVDGPNPALPPSPNPFVGIADNNITFTSLYVSTGTRVYVKSGWQQGQWHDIDTQNGIDKDWGIQTVQMEWDFDWSSGGNFDNQKQCWPPTYTYYDFSSDGVFQVKNRCNDIGSRIPGCL